MITSPFLLLFSELKRADHRRRRRRRRRRSRRRRRRRRRRQRQKSVVNEIGFEMTTKLTRRGVLGHFQIESLLGLASEIAAKWL